jgi:hypothetical protein
MWSKLLCCLLSGDNLGHILEMKAENRTSK